MRSLHGHHPHRKASLKPARMEKSRNWSLPILIAACLPLPSWHAAGASRAEGHLGGWMTAWAKQGWLAGEGMYQTCRQKTENKKSLIHIWSYLMLIWWFVDYFVSMKFLFLTIQQASSNWEHPVSVWKDLGDEVNRTHLLDADGQLKTWATWRDVLSWFIQLVKTWNIHILINIIEYYEKIYVWILIYYDISLYALWLLHMCFFVFSWPVCSEIELKLCVFFLSFPAIFHHFPVSTAPLRHGAGEDLVATWVPKKSSPFLIAYY